MKNISERLCDLQLIFERVPAIYGKTLCRNERARLYPSIRRRRELSDSEIGCYASHLKALSIIVERKLPRAIIMEDDAYFDTDFPVWANPGLPLPPNTDVLKLERFGRETTHAIFCGNHAGRSIIFASKPSFGAACYLVTQDGAQKILKKCIVIHGECDAQFFRYWKTGAFVYEVVPPPAWQDGSESILSVERQSLETVRKTKRMSKHARLKEWLPKHWGNASRFVFQVRHFRFKVFQRKRISNFMKTCPCNAQEAAPVINAIFQASIEPQPSAAQ